MNGQRSRIPRPLIQIGCLLGFLCLTSISQAEVWKNVKPGYSNEPERVDIPEYGNTGAFLASKFAQRGVPEMNVDIVRFAYGNRYRPVKYSSGPRDRATADCTEVVLAAYDRHDAVMPPRMGKGVSYDWGRRIAVLTPGDYVPRNLKPGDVLQLEDAYFYASRPDGYRYEARADHHSAIVTGFGPKKIAVLEQNWNNKRYVTEGLYHIDYLRRGTIYVYRPIPVEGNSVSIESGSLTSKRIVVRPTDEIDLRIEFDRGQNAWIKINKTVVDLDLVVKDSRGRIVAHDVRGAKTAPFVRFQATTGTPYRVTVSNPFPGRGAFASLTTNGDIR